MCNFSKMFFSEPKKCWYHVDNSWIFQYFSVKVLVRWVTVCTIETSDGKRQNWLSILLSNRTSSSKEAAGNRRENIVSSFYLLNEMNKTYQLSLHQMNIYTTRISNYYINICHLPVVKFTGTYNTFQLWNEM